MRGNPALVADAIEFNPTLVDAGVALEELEALRVADHVDDLWPVDEHEALAVQQHVVGRQVTVNPPVAREGEHDGAKLIEEVLEKIWIWPGRDEPRCGSRRPCREVPDERHQHLGLVELHRVGHREVELPQPTERVELGGGPLAGDDQLAELGAAGHRAHLARLAHPAALEVAGVAVEQAVVAVPVALGGHGADPCGARDPPADDVDVGLLAGLQHAEVALHGAEVGDDPVGPRFRSVGGPVPGGPSLALGWALGCGVSGEEGLLLRQVERLVCHCGAPGGGRNGWAGWCPGPSSTSRPPPGQRRACNGAGGTASGRMPGAHDPA